MYHVVDTITRQEYCRVNTLTHAVQEARAARDLLNRGYSVESRVNVYNAPFPAPKESTMPRETAPKLSRNKYLDDLSYIETPDDYTNNRVQLPAFDFSPLDSEQNDRHEGLDPLGWFLCVAIVFLPFVLAAVGAWLLF